MFKGLGNLTGMLQQAREMQEKMAAAKERITQLRVEGTSGGDMVRVTATGDLHIQKLHIDPAILASGDRELIEDLITAAINQALSKAKDAAAREMSEVAGSMNIPGMQEALSKFGIG